MAKLRPRCQLLICLILRGEGCNRQKYNVGSASFPNQTQIRSLFLPGQTVTDIEPWRLAFSGSNKGTLGDHVSERYDAERRRTFIVAGNLKAFHASRMMKVPSPRTCVRRGSQARKVRQLNHDFMSLLHLSHVIKSRSRRPWRKADVQHGSIS